MEIPKALRGDVKIAIAATAALGPIGAFSSVVDLSSIGVAWGGLLYKYSEYYGYNLDLETSKKLCLSTLTRLGGYYMGCKTATKLFHLIPGAGTLTAMGFSTLENVIFTYRFAISLTRVFEMEKVDFNTMAGSICSMFSGTWRGIISLKDIVALYVNI